MLKPSGREVYRLAPSRTKALGHFPHIHHSSHSHSPDFNNRNILKPQRMKDRVVKELNLNVSQE